MKARPMMFAAAIFALAVTGAAQATEREAPVVVYVDGLQPHVAAEVKKHADRGITALGRYLERTRKQHGLALEDVVRKPDIRTVGDIGPRKEYRKHAAEWR